MPPINNMLINKYKILQLKLELELYIYKTSQAETQTCLITEQLQVPMFQLDIPAGIVLSTSPLMIVVMLLLYLLIINKTWEMRILVI